MYVLLKTQEAQPCPDVQDEAAAMFWPSTTRHMENHKADMIRATKES